MKRITVTMEVDLHKKLKIQAAKDDSTINDLTVEAVKLYLHSRCKDI